MDIDCLKCINSACCKEPIAQVDIKEYDRLVDLGYESNMETYTDRFIERNPRYKDKKDIFDNVYKGIFAYLKKGDDGYCELLDRETMLCTIYKDRPKVCVDYKTNRCINIRKLKTN